MKVWSTFQQAIFKFVKNQLGNAIVEAVAGSGKTTTIVEAFKYATGLTLFLAFNKAICEELKAKGVNAKTFHGLCFGPVTSARNQRQVDANKLFRLCDQKLKGEEAALYTSFIVKLVSLAKQSGIGCLVPNTEQTWMDICVYHDLEPDNEAADLGRGIELAQMILDESNKSPLLDFDDLLYLAVLEGISLPKFDFIFVDEAQDTNALQRAILRKIMKPNSRMIAVGDPAQAIYGFRGADSNSLNLIAEEFDCIRLPLSISYRCAQSVVNYAQQWNEAIQAAPNAQEGEVIELDKWDLSVFSPKDLIVCRTTAPIINLAYRFLKERVPVQVMGREIGQGLKALIKRMSATSVDELLVNLDAYREREVEKAIAKKMDGKANAIEDKVSAIVCLVDSMPENGRSIQELNRTIDNLFSDKSNAVIMATIHKSKGLEADNVFWFNRSACPSKWAKQDWQKDQEANLCYVAATRAKQKLYLFEAKQ